MTVGKDFMVMVFWRRRWKSMRTSMRTSMRMGVRIGIGDNHVVAERSDLRVTSSI